MLPVYGLYTHIRANRIRSAILLGGLFALVYVLVFAGALIAEALSRDDDLSGYLVSAGWDTLRAAPWATLGTALWVGIAWRFHQGLIDAVTGARPVTRQDQPRIYNLLENLCISRGIPMPRLEVMESPALNAYATGLNPRQYAITVTSGLLDTLSDAELEAVLAHELTHIRNEDVRLMVVAVVIAGAVSFFGELLFRLMVNLRGLRWAGGGRSGGSGSDNRRGGGGAAVLAVLIGLALVLVAWLLSQVIRFALSRSREYLADAGAVELTKDPDAMIRALLKISGRGELAGVPSGLMEMCVDNPRSGFADLFATHPSIDARVAALVTNAGGRRPAPEEIAPPAPAAEAAAPAGPWGPADGHPPGPWDPA